MTRAMPHPNSTILRRRATAMAGRARLAALACAAILAISVASTASAAGTPTFVINTIDDVSFFSVTSAICGFPVYEHDTGTVTTMVTTLPDGSVKAHDVVVKITVTFFSTDPAHPGTVTTRPSGPFIEIDHPDTQAAKRKLVPDGGPEFAVVTGGQRQGGNQQRRVRRPPRQRPPGRHGGGGQG